MFPTFQLTFILFLLLFHSIQLDSLQYTVTHFLVWVFYACDLLFGQDLESSLQDLLSAVNLTIFPVLYFFTFLYYTDVIATGVVLLTYLLQLEGHTLLAALTGRGQAGMTCSVYDENKEYTLSHMQRTLREEDM